jgi:hypothetical protein
MCSKTVADQIRFNVSREGLFSFDFTAWSPGHFPEASDQSMLDFEVSAKLMLNQASVMNAFLVFFYAKEMELAHFSRSWMVVTPELRIPLDSLDGNTGMGFGNSSVAHLASSRFDSSYRPGLPISMDGRISFRGMAVDKSVVNKALDELENVMTSSVPDGLGLLELFLRAGKSYQDHNHAAAVISYWGIIERLLHELWIKFQDDNETRDGSSFVSAERKRRLSDGRTFTAAVITEQLSFGDRLPLDLYRKLNKVRKTRNDWMHGTKDRVSAADARTAAEACKGMFKLVRSIQVAVPAGLRLHG